MFSGSSSSNRSLLLFKESTNEGSQRRRLYDPLEARVLANDHLKVALTKAAAAQVSANETPIPFDEQGVAKLSWLGAYGNSGALLRELANKPLNLDAGVTKTAKRERHEENATRSDKKKIGARDLRAETLINVGRRRRHHKPRNPLLAASTAETPPETACSLSLYTTYLPMAQLWNEYANRVMGDVPIAAQRFARLLKMDLRGAIMKVVRSTNPCDLKVEEGIILQETARTIRIICRDNRVRCFEKENLAFVIKWNTDAFFILGSQMLKSPVQRTKQKSKTTTSLLLKP